MADPASWTIAAAAIASAAVGTYSAVDSHKMQKEAQAQQEEAQRKAEEKQAEADRTAEEKRLQALASNQTAVDYGNIWGVNSAKYADAAQKLSAGTGSFNTDDDETNPFYQRGLL